MRGPGLPPLPDEAAPPPPLEPQRLLAPASQRDPELESFLAKHRVSPSSSFLMLKLSREKAGAVMAGVSQSVDLAAASQREVEDAVLQRLKDLGVTSGKAGGSGSWTSVVAVESLPPRKEDRRDDLDGGRNKDLEAAFPGLPSLDGVLGAGLTSLLGEEEDVASPVDTANSHRPDRAFRETAAPPAPAEERDVSPPKPPARLAKERERASSPKAPKPTQPEMPKDWVPTGTPIFVKNLDKGTDERDLKDLFERHGVVSEVDMPKDAETGLGRGYAIISMTKAADAQTCIKLLNFTKPFGRALVVERYRRPGEPEVAEDTAEDNPARGKSSDRDKDAATAANKKKAKPGSRRKGSRSRSRGGSSSDSSGWSRYTVGSKKAKAKGKHRDGKKGKQRGKHSSSSYSEYSPCTSRSRSDSRKSRARDAPPGMMDGRGMPPNMFPPHGMPPGMFPMGPPPGMPPGMFPPGMQGMPPPWAMPPWMQQPQFDRMGYPVFDADEAERQLRDAEKKAKRESKTQVWDDHPARRGQKKRGGSGSSSPSRVPQRERTPSSSSKSSGSRKPRDRHKKSKGPPEPRRRSAPRDLLPLPPPPPLQVTESPVRLPAEAVVSDSDSDIAAGDVDMDKVQAEINFADI